MAEAKKSVFVELLDGTFNLISRTWLTSLILGGVLFIPSSFVFGWAYSRFLGSIKDMAGLAGEDPGPILLALGLGYLWILLAVLLQGFIALFVRACVTEHAARAVRGEPARTFEVALHVLKHRYGRLIGQRAVQLTILSITLSGVMLVTSLAIGIPAALDAPVIAAVLGVLLGLAGIAFVIWLAVRYTVTLESLVIDNTSIDQSIDQSMALVRHRWWHVFGWTLLFGLMVSFASSLIATPIMFFSTIRQFIHALETILREPSNSREFGSVFLGLLAGLGRRLGILQYVESLLASFVTPVFTTLLFLELKKPQEPPVASIDLNPPADSPTAEATP